MKLSKEFKLGFAVLTIIGIGGLIFYLISGSNDSEWSRDSISNLAKGDLLIYVLILAYAMYSRD